LERVVLFLWPLVSRLQYISRISQKNGLKKNVDYFERALNYYRKGKADMAAKVIHDLMENESKNAIKYLREKGYAK
jgi:hypothetical protein